MSAQTPISHPASPTTREEADAAWRKERETFIGASEVYHLFNLFQYAKGCARYLGYKKLGFEVVSEYSPEDQALLERGHLVEPLVADLYEEKTGRKVRRPPMDEFGFGKVRRHPDYPFLGVHTDRLILAGYGDVTETGDLEIKSHGEGMFLRIMREGVPPGHHLQVQHSTLVNRHSWGALAIIGIFGGLPLEHSDVKADPTIHDGIKQIGDVFWNNIVKQNLPDRLSNKDDLRCQVCPFRQECRGQEVDAAAMQFVKKQEKDAKTLVRIDDIELALDIKALDILKQEVKALTNDKEDQPGAIELLEGKILTRFAEMGITPNHKPYVPGVVSVSIVPTQFNGLDQKRLKTEQPEIWEKYYVANKMTGKLSLRLYRSKL